jgi:hypothetical protein
MSKTKKLEDIADAEMTVGFVKGKEGEFRSIEELGVRIYVLGMASGETSVEKAAQLHADLITTYNRLYPIIPPYVSKLKSADMPEREVNELRKNEYRHDVDDKINELLKRPKLTLQDIAPMFISKEINPTSAFHALQYISDAKEKGDGRYPEKNMVLVVGLVRTFEPEIFNKYRDVVQGLRKPRNYGPAEKTPLKS